MLHGPGIEPQWAGEISVSVQTGPGASPASFIMGTGPGVERPGSGVNHTLPYRAEIEEIVELHLGIRGRFLRGMSGK